MRSAFSTFVMILIASLYSGLAPAQTIDLEYSDRLEQEIDRKKTQELNAQSWSENASWPVSLSEGIEILCSYFGLIYLETSLSGLSVSSADGLGRKDLRLFYTWDTDYEIKSEVNRFCDVTQTVHAVKGKPEMVRCTPNPLLCEAGS